MLRIVLYKKTMAKKEAHAVWPILCRGGVIGCASTFQLNGVPLLYFCDHDKLSHP